MYIYQDGKLYAEIEDNKLVGVDVYSDKVLIVEGSESVLGEEYDILLPIEAKARFVVDGKPYIFPREKKTEGEVKDGTATATKRTSRKSTSK